MTSPTLSRKMSARSVLRRIAAMRGLLIVLGVLAVVVANAWLALARLSKPSEESGLAMATAKRGLFVYDISERGSIESANNVEIDCKVKSRSGGVTILEVVPEGTVIQPEDCIPEGAVVSLDAVLKLNLWRHQQEREKAGWSSGKHTAGLENEGATGLSSADSLSETAGDSEAPSTGEPGQQSESGAPGENELTFEDIRDKMVLVRFNSKEFEDSLLQQQIVCVQSQAIVRAAEATYNTAVISKKEYLEGTFQKLEKAQDAAIVRAKEALARSEEYLVYSEELWTKGFIPENELKANKFAVTDRQLAHDIAELEMDVLKKYTYEKEIGQLEANIGTAKARLVAAQKSHALDMDQLKEIEKQIVNCTIFARHPGQVVYANETDHHGHQEMVIEPGTVIRERQTVLRLPDQANMQVNARIHEAKVSLVEAGMRATVRLEASPHEVLQGEVTEVGEYPAETSWMRGDVKEYEVIVRIDGLDENARHDLRAGFTAEVNIRVAERPGALLLPIQSVLEHGGHHYCVVPAGKGQWEAREVELGLSNDKFVVVEDGLRENDQVVQDAVKHRDDLNLPEIKKGPARS